MTPRTWRPRGALRPLTDLLALVRRLSPAQRRVFERELNQMLGAARRGVTPQEWKKGKPDEHE